VSEPESIPEFRDSPDLLHDLTEARRRDGATAVLSSSAAVHHEFKNELQLFAALVERTHADPDRLRCFLHALAAAHDVLYRAADAPDAARLLQTLADHAWRVLADPMPVQLRLPQSPVPIEPQQTRPLALIAHELVVNAVRHSGADRIVVTLEVIGPLAALTVTDNGRGLPTGFCPETDGGFGLQLVGRLAREHFDHAVQWRPAPGGGTAVRVELACAAVPATT